MAMFLNIVTMMLCAGAMTYCYILGKQVRVLKDMRDGVGVLIEDMIKTTTELQHAFENTKYTVEGEYNKLNDKIDEGAVLGEYLESLMQDAQNIENNLAHRQNTFHKTSETKISPSSLSQARQAETFVNNVFENQHDPLEDVAPKGMGRPIKRPPPFIVPGEEYL